MTIKTVLIWQNKDTGQEYRFCPAYAVPDGYETFDDAVTELCSQNIEPTAFVFLCFKELYYPVMICRGGFSIIVCRDTFILQEDGGEYREYPVQRLCEEILPLNYNNMPGSSYSDGISQDFEIIDRTIEIYWPNCCGTASVYEGTRGNIISAFGRPFFVAAVEISDDYFVRTLLPHYFSVSETAELCKTIKKLKNEGWRYYNPFLHEAYMDETDAKIRSHITRFGKQTEPIELTKIRQLL